MSVRLQPCRKHGCIRARPAAVHAVACHQLSWWEDAGLLLAADFSRLFALLLQSTALAMRQSNGPESRPERIERKLLAVSSLLYLIQPTGSDIESKVFSISPEPRVKDATFFVESWRIPPYSIDALRLKMLNQLSIRLVH